MNDQPKPSENISMERIVQALDEHPAVAVPDDFAVRVMAHLPLKSRRTLLPRSVSFTSRYGQIAACVSLACLLLTMLFLAPRTATSSVWLMVQALLFVQFCVLLLWAGARLRRSTAA